MIPLRSWAPERRLPHAASQVAALYFPLMTHTAGLLCLRFFFSLYEVYIGNCGRAVFLRMPYDYGTLEGSVKYNRGKVYGAGTKMLVSVATVIKSVARYSSFIVPDVHLSSSGVV